jgi:sugar lactone lactonase YvrE
MLFLSIFKHAPDGIAVDSSGNVWVANYGNGTAGTAAGDSNVTELVGAASPVKTPLVLQPK